jgi:hypothetical protein
VRERERDREREREGGREGGRGIQREKLQSGFDTPAQKSRVAPSEPQRSPGSLGATPQADVRNDLKPRGCPDLLHNLSGQMF